MTLQGIISVPATHGFAETFQRLKHGFSERRKSRAAYRQTLNELSAMSERELADIGVCRSEIPLIASEAALLK